jgi:hypothetical protein
MSDRVRLESPLGVCESVDVHPTFRWRDVLGRGRTSLRVSPAAELRRTGVGEPVMVGGARWRLEVWPLQDGAEVQDALRGRPAIRIEVEGKSSWTPPKGRRLLKVATGYVWRVGLIGVRGSVSAVSAPGLFFIPDPLLPQPLRGLYCCTDESTLGGIATWVAAYGAPSFDPKAQSCLNQVGTVTLSGSWANGDAVSRALPAGATLRAGGVYQVSLCMRLVPDQRSTGRAAVTARVRVVAHQSALPDGGAHGAGATGVLRVADTGRVSSSGWTWVTLPAWRAPRDLDRLSLAAITDASQPAGWPGRVSIGSVCVVALDGCPDLFELSTAGGNVNLGSAVLVSEPPPSAQLVTTDLGRLEELFGSPFADDGSSEWYREGDGCVASGGWLPDDVRSEVPWATVDPSLPSREEVDAALASVLADLDEPDVSTLEPIKLSLAQCSDQDPVPHPRGPREKVQDDLWPPFGGRDIVYLHGLVPEHVVTRVVRAAPRLHGLINNTGFAPNGDLLGHVEDEWPAEPGTFLVDPADPASGYFCRAAETDYWGGHLQTYLEHPGHPNRFMFGGYNCSQRLIFAIHAFLAQVAAAMSTGAGVRAADGNTDCFGRQFVIVTHSTGALVANTAMAIAARTASDERLRSTFGDLSEIANRAQVHLSLHGATSGSELAELFVYAAHQLKMVQPVDETDRAEVLRALRIFVAAAAASSIRAGGFSELLAVSAAATIDTLAEAAAAVVEAVPASVLVDLSPPVTLATGSSGWAELSSGSPVPTLTVVGAHPSFGGTAELPVVGKLVLPGWDDGVVSASSQAASRTSGPPDRFRFLSPEARLFDMGIPTVRAASYYLEQRHMPTSAPATDRAGYAASPFVSPTGMVQPVAQTLPAQQHANHYRFLQSAAEHSFPVPHPLDQQSITHNYQPTGDALNYEESLVCDSSTPFETGLVDPTIIGLMHRFERRLDMTVTVKFPFPKITLMPPSIAIEHLTYSHTYTLWRRHYDLLTTGPPTVSEGSPVPVDVTPTGISIGNNLGPDPIASRLSTEHPASTCTYAYRYVLPR